MVDKLKRYEETGGGSFENINGGRWGVGDGRNTYMAKRGGG